MQEFFRQFEDYCKTPGVDSGKARSYAKAVEYLCDYMTGAKKTVPLGEELCERLKNEILREAQKNAPEGEERDDISVSVTVVS